MNTLYFSATRGFLRSDLHGNSIPSDAVEITSEKHSALLFGQSQGQVISSGQGGVPLLVDPPQTIVTTITALQGLLAIDQAGLSATYEAWANDPGRTFAERAFIDKAQTWRRDDLTLAAAATAFGLSGEQVDGLFELAATL